MNLDMNFIHCFSRVYPGAMSFAGYEVSGHTVSCCILISTLHFMRRRPCPIATILHFSLILSNLILRHRNIEDKSEKILYFFCKS